MATSSNDEVNSMRSELCEPCLSTCKEIPAAVYCRDCDEKYCEDCGYCHKKYRVSKDHRFCKVEDAPSDSFVRLMKELTICPNHQSEKVVSICVDDDQLCCNQCANTKHRHCRQLETIEQCMVTTSGHLWAGECVTEKCDVYNKMNYEQLQCEAIGVSRNWKYQSHGIHETTNTKNITSFETILDKLNVPDKQLADNVTHENNERALVAGSPVRVADYLQIFQAKLESAVNSLKTQVISQCETQTRQLLQKIETRQTSATNLQEQIKTNRENLNAMKQHGNDEQVFLLRRKISKEIQAFQISNRQLEECTATSTIEVVEQTAVDSIVRTIKSALRVQVHCGAYPRNDVEQPKRYFKNTSIHNKNPTHSSDEEYPTYSSENKYPNLTIEECATEDGMIVESF